MAPKTNTIKLTTPTNPTGTTVTQTVWPTPTFNTGLPVPQQVPGQAPAKK